MMWSHWLPGLWHRVPSVTCSHCPPARALTFSLRLAQSRGRRVRRVDVSQGIGGCDPWLLVWRVAVWVAHPSGMRRALALAVAVGVVFGVAGCGGGGDPNVLACQQWGDAFHGGGGDALVAGD